jgi:RP/EB family microtubule-associated protein
MSNIGLNDPAFFVGKNVLLKWLNDFFEIGYTKVEQTCTGAIHCQILDAIFPGKVALHKVNFDAKHDYEYVQNFKILQEVFNKMEVTRHVDVEKLIKGKYQDNLEMLQWMKNFFDLKYGGQEYKAKEKREQAQQGYKKGRPGGKGGTAAAPSKKEKKDAAPTENKEAVAAFVAQPAEKPASKAKKATDAKTSSIPAKKSPAKKKPTTASTRAGKENTDGKEVADVTGEITRMRNQMEALEKERAFYFNKLREIEILCQTDESVEATTKQAVLKILYHTDPDDGFSSPVEEDATAPVTAESSSASTTTANANASTTAATNENQEF